MQLLINALIAGSFAALMAGGLSLVYGVLRVFNLALGQLALVGGYVTWWLHQQAGLPLPAAIAGGIATGAAVTLVSFEVFVAPYYQRHRFLPLVTTIALSMILDGLILLVFEERPRAILSAAKTQLPVLGATISAEQTVLIALTVVLLGAVAWMLHATRFGRAIRATVQHPSAAQSLGINSALLHRVVFIASTPLAGIYVGIDQNLTPVLGFPITIKAYAALIAGGKDSLWGTIAAAYGIALLEQIAVGVPFFGFYVPAAYQSTVALVVIIVVLLFRPQGLFGSRVRIA
jgi:branched-chain amino acid transport system permease protein